MVLPQSLTRDKTAHMPPGRPRTRTLSFDAGLRGAFTYTSMTRPAIIRLDIRGAWVRAVIKAGTETSTYRWNLAESTLTLDRRARALTVDTGPATESFSLRALPKRARRAIAGILTGYQQVLLKDAS